MIHYHGTPINPERAAAVALAASHAFISFSDPRQLPLAACVCQSFAVDNGAFSAWRAGTPIADWGPFYEFAREAMRVPSCDFCVIPDAIDGGEDENDALLDAWPLPVWTGAPVWHLDEGLPRLARLVHDWPRVCLGSSGAFAQVGTPHWWARMGEAMRVACDDEGAPLARLHGLRMLAPAVFSRLPLASADSTNIARNVGLDQHWRGPYLPSTREARALVLRQRIELHNARSRWDFMPHDDHADQSLLF